MKKIVSIVSLCMILSGCATKIKYIDSSFEESDSPCFDGVLLNIREAGCREIKSYRLPHTDIIRLQCVRGGGDDLWLQHIYYVIPYTSTHIDDFVGNDVLFLCQDPVLMVGFKVER